MEEDRDREWECLPCGGPPPPQFSLPPPPRPPFLVDGECTEDGPLLAFEVCDAMPVLDAELHGSPALPSTAVIVGGCVLLLATLLIVSVLLFKYKRKVPHAAPNKAGAASASSASAGPNMHRDGASPAGLGGVGVGTGADAGYDGSGGVRTRAPQPADSPKLQMTDLKSNGAGYPNGFPVLRDPSLYIGSHPYISEDLYNPVYEEISHGSGERGETDSELPASEDEFAEDELSLAEAPRPPRSPPPPAPPPSLLHPLPLTASAGSLDGRGGRSRPPPPGAASATELPFYEPPSPDLRFSRCTVAHLPSPPPPAPAPGGATVGSVRRSRGHRSNDSEFHEGLLLDALLHQLYYQHQHQHSLPFAGAHAADLYGPMPTSPQPHHRTLPHFYHHPSAEVFTTLRHHHGVPATPSPVQHRHHHQHQQPQRRRPPVAHSGSALGLS